MPLRIVSSFTLAMTMGSTLCFASPKPLPPSWNFAVSGDSRNCGDVVVPSIAADARANHAKFYWHLGDLRAISNFDEDYRALHPDASILEYLSTAWIDFERNQIEPFGDLPFFLAIGNHETTPPKTREEFLLTFADWLDAPPIREQRLKDDPRDHTMRAYLPLDVRWRRFHQPGQCDHRSVRRCAAQMAERRFCRTISATPRSGRSSSACTRRYRRASRAITA